ncbi:uncharacterized protein LOC108666696 [Hyalella azteca]|uniref:Uncharacterized protein LOC108666696 n=1 Tax=Hyalella azteca TaxID=294128 RepID=A0A979FNN4_HYAAZ|nr:uncharacterized protein LOC108666696 [Hyalella azteca]
MKKKKKIFCYWPPIENVQALARNCSQVDASSWPSYLVTHVAVSSDDYNRAEKKMLQSVNSQSEASELDTSQATEDVGCWSLRQHSGPTCADNSSSSISNTLPAPKDGAPVENVTPRRSPRSKQHHVAAASGSKSFAGTRIARESVAAQDLSSKDDNSENLCRKNERLVKYEHM